MKKLVLLLLCTSMPAFTGTKAQSQQREFPPWKTYTIREDEFSAAFPKMPTVKDGREGSQKRWTRVLWSGADGVEYIIHVAENKPRLTLEEFIKEQTTSKPKWDPQSERALTVNGVSGKSFVYPNEKGMVQFFATEHRLYFFRAQGAHVDDARMTKFFLSVSLGKQDAGIAVSDGSSQSVEGERIYKASEVDTKVKIKSKPQPEYTELAKSKQVRGTVVLRCLFSANGTITRISVISGLPHGMTERTIAAARQIKFIPATKDGRNVSMWMQLEYNFNIF